MLLYANVCIQNTALTISILSILTHMIFAALTVLPPRSRIWAVAALFWHWIVVVLWAVVTGVFWTDYYNEDGGRVLEIAGVLGILNLLIWFGTAVMGCMGFCLGRRGKGKGKGKAEEV